MNNTGSENSPEHDSISHSRDTQQVDLFNLIGGSWPPALRAREHTEYGLVPRHSPTMQRPSQNERIKSVNLLAHIAPERRRPKTTPNTLSAIDNPKSKMVHEPKKIETGILVDICNLEAPEDVYDSPALGSPRTAPAPPAPPPPAHLQEDIGVGSLVEVATDVDQHYYGVVRWIGVLDETPTAGVELEQSVCGLGDGQRGGARLFACAPGRALFVPLPLCRRDARFRDTPPPDRHDLHDEQHYDQPECPVVPGVVPPLSSVGELAGKYRGIQGHHNSCYLDATLFAMFTFTSVFDALLYRPPEPEDSPHYSEVQRVLREEIVNPLRKHGYVRADRVMRLRTLLERLSDVPGLTCEEKDPEEFLNGLVAQLLRAEPFLKLSSGQEAYCYQLFVEKDEHVSLPSVQQLLEQSFATSGVKLSEAPEDVYDSPALGSPRTAPAPPAPPPPAHLQEDIGVGSLVEVATDVDQHYYGVVRWIGVLDETPTAGVELEQSVCGLGDGQRGGARLFACAPGRALFVPLPLCRRDARFRDTPPPDRHDLHDEQHYDQPECPVVPGVVPPLSSVGELAGKYRGIQGHHNSCYLDATLFAMFTFTSVFDALLYRPPEPEDSPHYSEVQRVLREEIVNPLRKHGYVRADRVMRLRTLLERLSDVPGLTCEEKDPEEFLNGLVAQLLRAEPFLKLSSGQEAYCYQLFVEKDEHVSLPSVQQLLEQSFATSGVKLSEVPAAFIIQMPRFGKQYKLYQRVLPSPLLDVTDLIEGLPRQCAVCGSLARWECGACAAGGGGGGAALDAGALCAACLRLAHASRPHHKATPLSVSEEYVNILETCPVPRVYMELFAVLCIETSHYVAFVKAGVGHDAPWCFFDSMADRKGERNGYNIPEIVCVAELGAWLGEESARATPRAPPAAAERLLADAYMCFYRSPDVAMYR